MAGFASQKDKTTAVFSLGVQAGMMGLFNKKSFNYAKRKKLPDASLQWLASRKIYFYFLQEKCFSGNN